MKKVLLSFCFCSSIIWSFAQVGIGNTNPDTSSILDITATDKGILLPRVALNNVTTNMLDGVNTAATGLFIYNTNATVTGGDGVGYYYFNGTIWEKITTSATNSDDHDFYEEGTTASPDDINDDIFTFGNVAIGKNTADYNLDISSTESRAVNIINAGVTAGNLYGAYIENSNTGSGNHYGSYSLLSNTGNGQQFGSFHGIANTGFGAHYGVYNDLTGTGNGSQYGIRNSISNTGDGLHQGVYNELGGTGIGNQIGIRSNISNSGDGDHYGTSNELSGSGDGFQYGVRNEISNSGTGLHYGVYTSLSGSGNSVHAGNYVTISGNGIGYQLGSMHDISNAGDGIHTGTENSLGGTGNGIQYGTHNLINNSGTSTHYGTYNELWGSATGNQYGTRNTIQISGDFAHYGSSNLINGSGNGMHYGSYNTLSGAGTGTQYGSYNYITNSGNSNHYGTYNTLTGNGLGQQFGTTNSVTSNVSNSGNVGTYNALSSIVNGNTQLWATLNTFGIGDGEKIGTKTENGSIGNGYHYGVHNWMWGSGSGNKYGTYSIIADTAGGTHYGLYSEVLKTGSYAGYFLGNVSIGTALGNNYILPVSRGTANQVIQTDGSGNLGWVNTSTIGDDLGNHGATTTLDLNSNEITEVFKINMLPQSNYDKYRLYNNAITTIGMHDNMTYGFLNNDWAMTFTVQEDADRGWIWRDINDAQSDGAMSLTADGRLTLKSHLRVDTNTLAVDATNNRVGIGITAPLTSLHVNHPSGNTNGLSLSNATSGDRWHMYVATTNDFYMYYNGVQRVRIDDATGNYFPSSDRRLKKEVTPINNVLQRIKTLTTYKYLYNDQEISDIKTIGFMAQDVQPLFPELVGTSEDGYLGLNYSGFGVLAIKAIQEQQEEIDSLKAQLAKQQQEIDAIKNLLKKQ